MIYLDTSLIVSALTAEIATIRAQESLKALGSTLVFVSDWSLTEFSAAMSMKMRSRAITEIERAATLRRFQRYVADSLRLVPVADRHFRQATQFADLHGSGLRAGDALHLAVVAELGATVWTLDQGMAAGGPIVGVPTRLV